VATLVVLLRGINVGGRNRVPMAGLRDLVESLGADDVATYLQSGNVVCRAAGSPDLLAGRLAAALSTGFGVTVPVVARTGRRWSDLVRDNPLAGLDDDPTRLHVAFLSAPADPDRARALEEEAVAFAPERLVVSGADVYLHCPGGYADTPLQNAFLEKRLDRVATTRNWRTVTALADLVADR
jgi:uncharacterized protein (DUF1697 family)